MKEKTSLVAALIILATPANVVATSYVGWYRDIESAETDDGRQVTGECYMYSEKYVELDGASTDSGEPVSGECYFYNIPSRNR